MTSAGIDTPGDAHQMSWSMTAKPCAAQPRRQRMRLHDRQFHGTPGRQSAQYVVEYTLRLAARRPPHASPRRRPTEPQRPRTPWHRRPPSTPRVRTRVAPHRRRQRRAAAACRAAHGEQTGTGTQTGRCIQPQRRRVAGAERHRSAPAVERRTEKTTADSAGTMGRIHEQVADHHHIGRHRSAGRPAIGTAPAKPHTVPRTPPPPGSRRPRRTGSTGRRRRVTLPAAAMRRDGREVRRRGGTDDDVHVLSFAPADSTACDEA